MAWPEEPAEITTEFLIDGVWTDYSERVRAEDGVRIVRGLVDEQSSLSAQSSNFTINNRDGLFSNRNPNSELYGKIGRSVQVRQGVKLDDSWLCHVRMPHSQFGDYASTADKASLDITGDIDVRAEIHPAAWHHQPWTVAGRYLIAGDQRSWLLTISPEGGFRLYTGSDGTFGTVFGYFSDPLPEGTGRIAIRVTLDVDNGSGGRTATFYTADSIDGTWVQHGSTVTATGTISIHGGTADLEVGSAGGGGAGLASHDPMAGRIYAFELYDGIDGTLVADFKPGTQEPGATTWADACTSPNTWTLTGDARITSDRIRFCGELTDLPQKWDKTGSDIFMPVRAAGLLQRLSDNTSPLNSAIYRHYDSRTDLTGWWPMEDQAGSGSAANVVPGGSVGNVTDVTFGSAGGLDGSAGAVTLNSSPGSKILLYPKSGPTTGFASILFYFKLSSLPASNTTMVTLGTSGTGGRITIGVGATDFQFTTYARDGSTLDSGGSLFGAGASPLDQWIGMQYRLVLEGSNTRWITTWHAVGTDIFYTHFSGGDSYAGTTGAITSVSIDAATDSAFSGAQFAHFVVSSGTLDLNTANVANASKGYSGETAGTRIERLCEEEGVALEGWGDLADTEPMGPQAPNTLAALLAEAAEVDGGVLSEIRDRLGFRYATRIHLGNRRGMELDYGDKVLSEVPDPVEDNRYTVNDMTVTRAAGTSARHEVTDPQLLNVEDPPIGVGRYARSATLNVATDQQVAPLAGFKAFVGSWNELRIPTLAIGLHRAPFLADASLTDAALRSDAGDPVQLTGMPSFMPPDDLRMLIYGYTEEIRQFTWDLIFNTVPQGPFQAGYLDEEVDEIRLDSAASTLLLPITASATSAQFATPDGSAPWINSTDHSAHFPVDLKVGGERITLTAATEATASVASTPGTFEADDEGWDAFDAAFTQSSTQSRTGTYAGRLEVVGSPAQAYARAPGVACVEGMEFSGAAWVRAGSIRTISFTIDWLDENFDWLATDADPISVAAGVWTEVTLTATAPADAAWAVYGTTMSGSPPTGAVYYTDDVTFELAGAVTQTATITRSVNGIVKAHQAGSTVRLFNPTYLEL